MWEGGRDQEDWKQKEVDDSSIESARSLLSLDRTCAGDQSLDLLEPDECGAKGEQSAFVHPEG
jgi:hypothetical protein